MPNSTAFDQVYLNGQLLTLVNGQLFINGTGIPNLSTVNSLSGNLIQTGVQLGAKIDSLSGFTLGASGALNALIVGGGSQVRVSGSSTIPIADFTGLGTTSVFSSGGKIFVSGANATPKIVQVACSDTSTSITVGSGKVTFRMPFPMLLTGARASVAVPPGGTNIQIGARASGLQLFATGLFIDVAKLTSVTSATGVAISGLNAFIPDDAEIKADFIQVGSSTGGTEVVLTLMGI